MRRISGTFLLSLALLGALVLPAFGEPRSLQSQVGGVLDRWTAFRWGQDNLVWVVHYPEALAAPWVKLEAQRRGLGPEETESYRKSFRQELQFDRSVAFLLNVQAFGRTPLSLAPLSKNVFLVDGRGKSIPPVRYEKRLDQPLSGLVQGFVFFPKGVKPPFRLVVKGLIPGEATAFAFPAFGEADTAPRVAPTPSPRRLGAGKISAPQGVDLVVPPKKPEAPQVTRTEIPRPTRPAVPTKAPEATRPPKRAVSPPVSTSPPPRTVPSPPPAASGEVRPSLSPSSPKSGPASREEVLRRFLELWQKGDWDGLYAVTGKETKGRFSASEFAERTKNHPFRWALKEGYKLSWSGNTAKVSVAPKFLVVRMLREEQFRLVEEEGGYRVVW